MGFLSPVLCLPVVAVLSWNCYQANQAIERLSTNRPVFVVPGALSGVYTPGLNDEVLKNNVRYWTGLLTNFQRKTAKDGMDELENFADSTNVATFQSLRDKLLQEVDQQSQARLFVEAKGSAKLSRLEDGTYKFVIRGDRTIWSAGIILLEDQADVEWHFRLGTPSEKNPYGMYFLRVDVSEVAGSKKAS